MVLVAAPVANASYHHLSGLYRHFFPDDRLTVWFGPLAIDGATLMCTAALQSRAQRLRAEQHIAPLTTPVIPPSPEALTGEHYGSVGEPGGEAGLTDTRPARPVGAMTRLAAVGPASPLFAGETGSPLLASPSSSPVSVITVTGEDGEPQVFSGKAGSSPAAPESEEDEPEKPTDGEILTEARRLRPEGPFSANWLVRTFGIGTGRATRLLNQLAPALVAEAAATDAESVHTALPNRESQPV
ncbi:hypothetical protein GCM10009839_14450 [Catenulispora yoronensis]|uniref:Uncharacterized protein n=2 Tax=Catenulispora yoronensis TaxID=450799 RepID=A0ABP5F7I9_9ACTN